MPYDPDRHHRRSIRLKGYDYSQEGAYYVTVCVRNRQCLFGEVVEGEMALSAWGEIVQQEWLQTAVVRPYVRLDEFMVMPNHFHGILCIVDDSGRGDARVAPTGTERTDAVHGSHGPQPGSLGAIVGAFKSAATKRINVLRVSPGAKVWQRGYWEHIIRHDRALDRIREYIATNPARWALDPENPDRRGEDEFDRWLASYATGLVE